MFLNAFHDVNSLEYIVDVNPHKCGLYIPGTGQRVVSPDILKQYRPDVLVIVNANYRDEISQQVRSLGDIPRFAFNLKKSFAAGTKKELYHEHRLRGQ